MRSRPLAALVCAALVLAACVTKTPLPTDQQVYAGRWVAADGTFVHVYLDGGGDLKASGTEVTGGATKIADGKLEIGMGPVKKAYTITKPPSEEGGAWSMQLDGMTFTKQN